MCIIKNIDILSCFRKTITLICYKYPGHNNEDRGTITGKLFSEEMAVFLTEGVFPFLSSSSKKTPTSKVGDELRLLPT